MYDLARQRIGWANYDCKFRLIRKIHDQFSSEILSSHVKTNSDTMLKLKLSGSLSVNVSVTSGKDQFMNEGQLSVNNSSGDVSLKLLFVTMMAILMHLLVCMELYFL